MTRDEERKECVAGRLKLAREQTGLSQGQVAKKLGFHRPSVSDIEAGRRNVSVQELVRFSELYNVDVNWLSCVNTERSDLGRDRIELAARELSKMKQEDLDKLIGLISSLKNK